MTPQPGWLAVVGGYGTADSARLHVVEVGPGPRLRRLASFAGVEDPSYLIAGPEATLFVASEVPEGAVHRFDIRDDGRRIELTARDRVGTGGAHPCHLALHPSGRWLAAANYGTGSVALVDAHGRMRRTALDRHVGTGPVAGRQEAPHAHAACFTPDGHHLVATDLGADQLAVSRIDPVTGDLARVLTVPTRPGSGPRHLLFRGRLLVVVNELSNTVASYRWDPSGPGLEPVDERTTLPPDAEGGLAAALRAAPSGRHLYVSNRGPDSVSAMELDEDGIFGSMEAFPAGGASPRDIAVTPDGTALLVANERDDHITYLPIGPDGARVGQPVTRLELPAPTSITFAGRRPQPSA